MAEFCDLPGVALRIAPNDFPDPKLDETDASGERTVILAGGCFWCTESVFKNLDGVLEEILRRDLAGLRITRRRSARAAWRSP